MKRLANIICTMMLGLLPLHVSASYSVSIDLDNAEAVTVKVDGAVVSHTAGINELTAETLIEVSVAEGYAFTSFNGDNGLSYLQYDNQTTPVLIREYISTGMGESESNDGLHFVVKTVNLAADRTIPLTITVSNPEAVQVKVGTSAYFTSSSNRKVTLTEGVNTVYYAPSEKYVLVSSTKLWTPLGSVTLNGRELTMGYDYVYVGALPSSGATLDIVEATPLLPGMSFTATIDDPAQIKYFTRLPSNEDLAISEGDNEIAFAEGDTFRVYCYGRAKVCTLDGVDVVPEETNGVIIYDFTPTEGAQLVMTFGTAATGKKLSFTLYVDNLDKLNYFTRDGNPEVELLDTLEEGNNVVEFREGEQYSLWPKYGEEPRAVMKNGQLLPRHETMNVYYFKPADGDRVEVYFDSVPTAIEQVAIEEDALIGDIYTLQGLKVGKEGLPRGLYIINGKKIILR